MYSQTLQSKQKNLKRNVKAMDLSSDKFDLCNQTLTDLWNICPDNLAACQDSNRKFTPEVDIKTIKQNAVNLCAVSV